MEVAEQYSKRPRLNSWESTSISSFPGQQQQQQQSYYSPHSQYSGSTISMEGWGETKPRSLSTSAGGSNKPPSQHFSAYLNSPPSSHMSSTGHRLSMNAGTISPSLSSEAHAYSNSFQEQSEMDPSTANSTPPSGSIQARLKPLHTASAFQDQVTYFHAHYEQQPSAAGPNSHRGSINDPTSAAEMSPTSSNVGIALGAYPGSGFSHQLVAASPQGIVLGAPQAVNVVTTYPPRRKAIRAAQARPFPSLPHMLHS